jgi:hypothetical protein
MDEIRKAQQDRVAMGIFPQGFDEDIYGHSLEKGKYLDSVYEDEFDNEEQADVSSRPYGRPDGEAVHIDGDADVDCRERYGSGIVDTRISNRESEVRRSPIYFVFCLVSRRRFFSALHCLI